MRTRSITLVALSALALAATSAFACGAAKDGSSASAGAGCSASKTAAATAADTKTASAGPSCCPGAGAAGAGCSAHALATDAGVATATPIADNQIAYNVSGMVCSVGCVGKVEGAVAKLDLEGVENVQVDFDKKLAIVTVAEGAEVDSDVIAQAISDAGYPTTLVDAKAETKDAAPAEKAEDTATM